MFDIGTGKVAIDTSTGFITLPSNFCHFTDSKEELFSVFPRTYHNHNWLSERAIFTAKNKDVDDFSATSKNFIPGELFSFKSVNTVINQDEVINYPTKLFNSMDLSGLSPHIYN